MTPDMDAQWLKDELAQPGRSQSDLARYLGFDHPSIVNRMCKGERQIKAIEADKIREYLNATARGDETPLRRITPSLSPTAPLIVRGTVEAGSWREVSMIEADFEPETLVAPRSIVESGAFALRVAGFSMDTLYPPGTYVIVQPWLGGMLPYGKRVIIERIRDGLVETTIKELVHRDDGMDELWPRSTHPAHQAPLSYRAEDATVRLTGVVVSSYRPE